MSYQDGELAFPCGHPRTRVNTSVRGVGYPICKLCATARRPAYQPPSPEKKRQYAEQRRTNALLRATLSQQAQHS